MNRLFAIAAASLLLCILLLGGCGKTEEPEPTPEPTPTPVLFPDGREIRPEATFIDLQNISHEEVGSTAALLGELPNLIAAKTANISIDDFMLLFRAAPDVIWTYRFEFRGETVRVGAENLDLVGINKAEIAQILKILPAMKQLKNVTLGSETENPLDWSDITKIAQAAPWAAYDYDFAVYGVKCNLSDKKLDLWKIPVEDGCADVYKVLPAMTKCTYVDMDGSGVDTPEMVKLRDAFPDKTVVWRVTFSWGYSVRTDTEKILCSLTADLYGDNGLTDEKSVEALKYCTKVKYLDLGHNNKMETISFTAYMPDLEVLIIYKDKITDITPLANCKKLRYLELCKNPVEDISVLGGLTELTDLEIGSCPNITDISCLYGLDKLQRLWIGDITKAPKEQIEKFCELHPDCVVNTTDNEIDNTWRYYAMDWYAGNVYWPRYQEIRDIFNYGENAQGQSLPQFDPYFTKTRDY